MRRTLVGIVLLTYCVLVAPVALADHTVTPPRLPQEWLDNSSKLVPDTDPVKAAHTLGVAIADALNKGDAQAAANFVDSHALATRIAATMYTDPAQQQTFVNGFGRWTVPEVFKMYHESLQQGHGSAKFMRVVMRAGEPRALVRVYGGTDSVDYLELLIGRNSSGEYRVIDWYQLVWGRMISDTLGAGTKLMRDPDQSLLDRVFGTTTASADIVAKMRRIGTLEVQGKYSEALGLMNELPPEFAESLEILRAREVAAVSSQNGAEYERALNTIAAKYGDQPSVALLLMPYYLKHRQFGRVSAGFTIIENRVGTDGVTNTLREMFSQQAGALTEAVKYGQKAVAIEPDLPQAWYFLGTSYVYVKNYPQAVASFQTLQTRFGAKLTRDQFVGPGWEGFTRSDAFKHWMPH